MLKRRTPTRRLRSYDLVFAVVAWIAMAFGAVSAFAATRSKAASSRTEKRPTRTVKPAKSGATPAAKVSAKASTKAPTKTSAKTSTRTTSRRARTTRVLASKTKPRTATRTRSKATRPASVTPAREVEGTVDEHVHLRRGDTLERLLLSRGVSPSEASTWLGVAGEVYDLRGVRPRQGCTLRFDRASRELVSLRYEIDKSNLLVLDRTDDGVVARREELPYFVELRGIAGRIERGLREDVRAAGAPMRLAADLADIFGWEFDTRDGLRPGDEFKLIYENIWEAGLPEPQLGKVVGAEIVSKGKRLTAFLFEDEAGHAGYFTPKGEPLARNFLRYPVEFTEVSSEFSDNRLHPILGVHRPHLGVDLAARYGTPVRAAGDGVVTHAGGMSGLGTCVKIDHDGGIRSTYGHLSRMAPKLQEGARVEIGQIIGYVGSTGLATGPHLHYEIERNDEHVDPLTVALPKGEPVLPESRGAFTRLRRRLTDKLSQLVVTGRPVAMSLAPLPAE